MSVRGATGSVLQRPWDWLAFAVPIAWRHDRLFRGAAIGASITLVLFALRALTPYDPALDRPAAIVRAPSATLSSSSQVPNRSTDTGSPGSPVSQSPVQKIAPGQPLGDLTIQPAPDNDRFGRFTPGRR